MCPGQELVLPNETGRFVIFAPSESVEFCYDVAKCRVVTRPSQSSLTV